MTVDLELDDVRAPLGLEASLCLYRIAQEALHNVVKHSGASHATVSLKAVGGELVYELSTAAWGSIRGRCTRQTHLVSSACVSARRLCRHASWCRRNQDTAL